MNLQASSVALLLAVVIATAPASRLTAEEDARLPAWTKQAPSAGAIWGDEGEDWGRREIPWSFSEDDAAIDIQGIPGPLFPVGTLDEAKKGTKVFRSANGKKSFKITNDSKGAEIAFRGEDTASGEKFELTVGSGGRPQEFKSTYASGRLMARGRISGGEDTGVRRDRVEIQVWWPNGVSAVAGIYDEGYNNTSSDLALFDPTGQKRYWMEQAASGCPGGGPGSTALTDDPQGPRAQTAPISATAGTAWIPLFVQERVGEEVVQGIKLINVAEIQAKDGKVEGRLQWGLPLAGIQAELNTKGGWLEGTFHVNGPGLEAKGSFQRGSPTGTWGKKGFWGYRGRYVQGKREGVWDEYQYFSDGCNNDLGYDGHSFRQYRAGVLQGLSIEARYETVCWCSYKDGQLHGSYKVTDRIHGSEEGQHENGERVGHWIYRDKDGRKTQEGGLNEGKRHGEWNTWDVTRGLHAHGRYSHGELSGMWLEELDGKLFRKLLYSQPGKEPQVFRATPGEGWQRPAKPVKLGKLGLSQGNNSFGVAPIHFRFYPLSWTPAADGDMRDALHSDWFKAPGNRPSWDRSLPGCNCGEYIVAEDLFLIPWGLGPGKAGPREQKIYPYLSFHGKDNIGAYSETEKRSDLYSLDGHLLGWRMDTDATFGDGVVQEPTEPIGAKNGYKLDLQYGICVPGEQDCQQLTLVKTSDPTKSLDQVHLPLGLPARRKYSTSKYTDEIYETDPIKQQPWQQPSDGLYYMAVGTDDGIRVFRYSVDWGKLEKEAQ